MIILVDVIFAVLFVSLLQQRTEPRFILPQDALFKGGAIYALNGAEEPWRYDSDHEEWIRAYGSAWNFALPCGYAFCRALTPPAGLHHEQLRVMVPDTITTEVYYLLFHLCQKRGRQCGALHFTITADGYLDTVAFAQRYPQLANTAAFDHYQRNIAGTR